MKLLCRSLFVLLLLTGCSAETAPTFDRNTLQVINDSGDTLSLNAISNKTLVVNFWASWCAPCVHELPALQRLSKALDSNRYQIILISVDADPLQGKAKLAELGIQLPAYYDPAMALANGVFAIKGYPETLVLGEQGEMLARVLGAKDWDKPAVWQEYLPQN